MLKCVINTELFSFFLITYSTRVFVSAEVNNYLIKFKQALGNR